MPSISHASVDEPQPDGRPGDAARWARRQTYDLLGAALVMAVGVTADGRVVYANEHVLTVTGWHLDEVIGRPWYDVWSRDDERDVARQTFTAMVAGALIPERLTVTLHRRDGEPMTVALTLAPRVDRAGRTTAIAAVGVDISERVHLQRQRRELAIVADLSGELAAIAAFRGRHDRLTGLVNRDYFEELLDETIHARARGDGQCAVVLLQIDRFAAVADTLGHAVSKELLAQVATRLSATLTKPATLARWGVDQFAVLLPAATANRAMRVCRLLLEALHEPIVVGDSTFHVAASLGVATHPAHGTTSSAILNNASIAMREAMRDGGDRCRQYQAHFGVSARERLDFANLLPGAARRSELILHYQPVVSLTTGQVVGAEALMRWKHPTRGLLQPASFIPIAEETGNMSVLGRWALTTACAQSRAWRDAGLPPIPVAVNLSARQLQDNRIVADVAAVLDWSQLSPVDLQLEITESALIHDVDRAGAMLHELSEMGVRLALDDFGTGYSSLSQLRRLPITILKIDRSFVEGLTSDPSAGAIAVSLFGLARRMQIGVVAEGIGTDQQLAVLRSEGCEAGQGFLFSRPVPSEAMHEVLESHWLVGTPAALPRRARPEDALAS